MQTKTESVRRRFPDLVDTFVVTLEAAYLFALIGIRYRDYALYRDFAVFAQYVEAQKSETAPAERHIRIVLQIRRKISVGVIVRRALEAELRARFRH